MLVPAFPPECIIDIKVLLVQKTYIISRRIEWAILTIEPCTLCLFPNIPYFSLLLLLLVLLLLLLLFFF